MDGKHHKPSFTIVVDTRELLPYTFGGMEPAVEIITRTLKSGCWKNSGNTPKKKLKNNSRKGAQRIDGVRG